MRIEPGDRSPDDVAAIARAWGDAVVTAGGPLPAAHRDVTPAGGAIAHALAGLSQAVTLAAIEARRGELWMLHAGGLSDDDGNVVAIVGPSGRGKTTATRALAAHYGYVTDETVGVAADGTVLPYRKPLSIIEDPLADKAQRSGSELGLGALPAAPLRLSAIVLLDRVPGGPAQPVLEPCDLADALPELVEQTSYLADLPAPLRRVAAHVAAVGGVHRVTYSEAETLAAALAPLFRPAAEIEHVRAAASAPESAGAAPADTTGTETSWWRGAHLDVLELAPVVDDGPERLALLQPEADGGATLRILDGIGPTLWRVAATPRTAGGLVAAVVSEHGAPPTGDPGAAVAAAVAALATEGVLVREPSWRVRSDVAWTANGDGFAALPLGRGGAPEPVALEGTAALIWAALTTARGATADALVRAVASRGDLDAIEIDGDVRVFLGLLADRGLAELYLP